jgi:hypothetical protein
MQAAKALPLVAPVEAANCARRGFGRGNQSGEQNSASSIALMFPLRRVAPGKPGPDGFCPVITLP